MLLFAALAVAQLFRPTSKQSTGVLSKAAGLVVLVTAGFILTTQSASFLGIAGAIAVYGYDGFLYSIGFLVEIGRAHV